MNFVERARHRKAMAKKTEAKAEQASAARAPVPMTPDERDMTFLQRAKYLKAMEKKDKAEAEREQAQAAPFQTPVPQTSGTTSAYGRSALTDELQILANTTKGSRNDQLNTSAFNLGQLLPGGDIDEQHLRDQLTRVAFEIGLDATEIPGTVNSGVEAGKLEPRADRPGRAPISTSPETAASTGDVDGAGATRAVSRLHHGQLRLAHLLAAEHEHRLLYVPGIGWFYWDEKRWARDETGVAHRAVITTLRRALAASLDDPELRKDVRKCESAAGVRGVLELAGTLKELVAAAYQLDIDPHLLNVANGTLDLRTGTLRPHDPADRITKVTRAAYRPCESSPMWQAFLDTVLPDTATQEFLRRVVGVALIGKVREHVLVLLTGIGANGKGVFYGATLYALGDYAAPADPDLFTGKQGAHPTGQMDLRGRRLVVVSESEEGRRLNSATMKRLTGGDTIKARLMGKDFVEFTPSHLAILVTNFLPAVSGDDEALWRRLRVVPFTVVVPEQDRDPRLGEKLELEADAVLSWAVAGHSDYVARGERLDAPDSVQHATSTYRIDSDAVGRFLDDCCLLNPHMRATTAELHSRWQSWAVSDGAEPLSQKAFGQNLDRRGLTALPPTNGKRYRRGVGLAGDDDDQDGGDRTRY